ncbi:MAG: flagellar hook-basal body complex protein FliE [Rhodospirillaceae bacterium]|nr:flagellar hook-basal body complex protein FliE [Rhodospirillaceae bacterium]MCK5545756.1 flagellar hook-basal body complex protein FliE [Rhodospirillaceae bacterium]
MAIDPTANVANALQAYTQANNTGSVANVLPAQDGPQPQSGAFAQLVTNSVSQAVAQGKTSEQVAISGITGGADMAQLALAVSEAEITLQTVVAVRDKVVDAYREILRMPI